MYGFCAFGASWLLGLLPLDFIRKPAFSLLAYKLVFLLLSACIIRKPAFPLLAYKLAFLLLSACIIRKPAYIRFACNPIISHKHCPLHENHGFHKFHISLFEDFLYRLLHAIPVITTFRINQLYKTNFILLHTNLSFYFFV